VYRKFLEIGLLKAYSGYMDRDHMQAPAHWVEELARSDDEVARGERVPASVIHDDILRVIAELEADDNETADILVRNRRGR
jgi:hypothetical protein